MFPVKSSPQSLSTVTDVIVFSWIMVTGLPVDPLDCVLMTHLVARTLLGGGYLFKGGGHPIHRY